MMFDAVCVGVSFPSANGLKTCTSIPRQPGRWDLWLAPRKVSARRSPRCDTKILLSYHTDPPVHSHRYGEKNSVDNFHWVSTFFCISILAHCQYRAPVLRGPAEERTWWSHREGSPEARNRASNAAGSRSAKELLKNANQLRESPRKRATDRVERQRERERERERQRKITRQMGRGCSTIQENDLHAYVPYV